MTGSSILSRNTPPDAGRTSSRLKLVSVAVAGLLIIGGVTGILLLTRPGASPSGNSLPIGGAPQVVIEFGAVTAINVSGSTNGPGGCSGPGTGATAYCFLVPIKFVASGVNVSNFTLSVQASLFNTTVVEQNITLLSAGGILLATMSASGTWAPFGGGSSLPTVATNDTLVVNAGESTSALGCGAEMIASVHDSWGSNGVEVDFPSPLPPIASVIQFGNATLFTANGTTNERGGCSGPGAGLTEYCYEFPIVGISTHANTAEFVVTATNLSGVPVQVVNVSLMNSADAILATYRPGTGWQAAGTSVLPISLADGQSLIFNLGTNPGDGFHIYVDGVGPVSCWVNLWAYWPFVPIDSVLQLSLATSTDAIGTTPGPGGCAAPGAGRTEDCFQLTISLAKENISTAGLTIEVTNETQGSQSYQNITLVSQGGTILAVYTEQSGWEGYGGTLLPVYFTSGQSLVINIGVDENPQVQVHFSDTFFAGGFVEGFGG
jgi:hypothetical protein